MTRTPFDTFTKQILEELLTPFGTVEISQEVPGESRFIDIRFMPTTQPSTDPATLGLLGRMATHPCLIEPFRNPPSRTEVRNCLLKLFLVQADVQRQARREDDRTLEAELPQLWILSPSASDVLLNGFATQQQDTWLPGIHFMGECFKTAIIAINQLPCNDETRWLRLLGKGRTQQQAIAEVLAFPAHDPRRASVLQLLVNWKISLNVIGELEQEEQDLMAALSQAYLEWEQQTEQRGIEQGIEQGIERGERSLILRQLTRQVGELPEPVRSQIEALSIISLEPLGEALLEFSSLSDLEAWLIEQR
ncbi:MAG: DUF4351 domain-containing protein [Cyanobacteria bacterium RU_5_0]|nr:DUF4351 domain-containing protein [Cyanobacteria bacterium RU_5_0]